MKKESKKEEPLWKKETENSRIMSREEFEKRYGRQYPLSTTIITGVPILRS